MSVGLPLPWPGGGAGGVGSGADGDLIQPESYAENADVSEEVLKCSNIYQGANLPSCFGKIMSFSTPTPSIFGKRNPYDFGNLRM